jgi:hypothetical protein
MQSNCSFKKTIFLKSTISLTFALRSIYVNVEENVYIYLSLYKWEGFETSSSSSNVFFLFACCFFFLYFFSEKRISVLISSLRMSPNSIVYWPVDASRVDHPLQMNLRPRLPPATYELTFRLVERRFFAFRAAQRPPAHAAKVNLRVVRRRSASVPKRRVPRLVTADAHGGGELLGTEK